MSVTISNRSRLRFKELLDVDGVQFWDLDNLPEVPVSTDDLYYRVLQDDRIDLIANTFYSDSNMWWVIALANDMYLLPTDLIPGRVIRIPSPTYVSETLFLNSVG